MAVRLAIKSTSAEIVSAIQADKAAFIRVRSCLHCAARERSHECSERKEWILELMSGHPATLATRVHLNYGTQTSLRVSC